MLPHTLVSRNARVPKVLLMCLIFYGARKLSRISVTHLYLGLCALKKKFRAISRLFGQIRRCFSAAGLYLVEGTQDHLENRPPYTSLSCSSIPYHFSSQGGNSGPEPLQIPLQPLSPTDSRTASPVQSNLNRTSPELRPSQSSFESFTLQPPEPFLDIFPITSAQLVPRRWPVSQEEPLEVPDLYTNDLMIPKNAAIGLIPPYTTNFNPDRTIPGWTTYLHPQGPLYYYNEDKKVLTNANIFEDDNLRIIDSTVDQLFQKLANDGVEVPPDTQLVIDIRWDRLMIGYYFATLQHKCLFWAHEKHVKPLFKRVEHVWSHSHIGHVIEAELWLHYQLFPHVQILPAAVLREIKGFLLFTTTDQIFNAKTTSEYSADEVDKALSVINSIPLEFVDAPGRVSLEAGYYFWIAGCIMALNALHRFDNHHGQPNARWLRDDFLYEDSEERTRTLTIAILSPVLFYTPETYYHSLVNIMNDGNIFFEAWRNFVVELHQEWNGLIIIATVLLATNMAFLAIPTIDPGTTQQNRSSSQISSYLSIILSVSSIAIGQLLSRYHRIKGWEHFDERITKNFEFLLDVGCSQLAIMYSLPYALLSWSLIAFLVAFLIMCFTGQKVVRLTIGITSAVLMLAMFYCVRQMRDNDEQRSKRAFLIRAYWRLYSIFDRYYSQLRRNKYSIEPHATSSQTPPVQQVSNV